MYKLVLVKLAILLSFALPVQAVDIENGKTLHDENCLRCHNETKYTRNDRLVNNFYELRTRIRDCELMAEAAWFDEEIDDVAAYLNQAFYHFKIEK